MEKIRFERSRVVGFSDAVFGIAMTLLILEVAAPTFNTLNKFGLWTTLKAKIPSFIGFIVSFFVTALYWIDYLKITKFTSHFNLKMLWANILVLFFVVLLPFSTSLYVNGINLVEPFVFYSLNLAMIAFMILLLIRLVYKQEKENKTYSKKQRNLHSAKIINTASVWVLASIFAFISIKVARFLWILIFIVDPLLDWYYLKYRDKQ